MLKLFVRLFIAFAIINITNAVAATQKPIRIAFIDVLSGPFGAGGQWALDQFRFDAERINKEGGLDGRKLEIVALDNGGEINTSLIMLNKALDSGIRYITQGGGSAVAAALLDAINKHNERNPGDIALYLNYAALDPVLTNEACSFWHFRFNADTDMQTKAVAKWIVTQPSMKHVYLFNQNYSYGQSIAASAAVMLRQTDDHVKIVGDSFVPPGKVKDFAPYVVQMKRANADVIITSNWGEDLVLLAKAANDLGLKTPFVTYNANTPGFIKQIGKSGIGKVYLVSANPYGYSKRPDLAESNKELFAKTGWDYQNIRITDEIDMLRAAADKAKSVDPTKIAFALEGLHYMSPVGEVTMRRLDHQIQQPLFITELANEGEYGMEGTDIGFREVAAFTSKELELPSRCKMRRPAE